MYKILVFIFVLFSLSACGQSQSDIDAAKQKLLQWEWESSWEISQTWSWELSAQTWSEDALTQEVQDEDSSNKQKRVQVIPQTAEQFLEFDAIDESKIASWEIEISGTTNTRVDKIQVLFSNRESEFVNDDYTLQTFEEGDKEFRYVASSRNKVLDFGENTYTFRAYSGKEITETRIMIRVNEWFSEDSSVERQLIGSQDDTALVDLPTSTAYGEPVKLGEQSFTYSQIKGLEIGKEVFEKPSCAWLTEFLRGRINNWFYWNTCRDLVAGEGIFYNVIRLDGDEYVYERHYVDFVHGFYGSYELERGEWVTKDTIQQKNTELKSQQFESVKVVDQLMRDIINS